MLVVCLHSNIPINHTPCSVRLRCVGQSGCESFKFLLVLQYYCVEVLDLMYVHIFGA